MNLELETIKSLYAFMVIRHCVWVNHKSHINER